MGYNGQENRKGEIFMPVKSQGTSKYPPLTDREKKEIIARHKDLVDKLNAVLPEGQKVTYDKNILKKLNDPEVVAVYRIGNEMKDIGEKQERIRADLEKRFGKYNGYKEHPFARNFNYYLRVDDTEDAKKFNEKLYDDYLHNPDKLAYIRYKDVLKINPQEILDCKDSHYKLAEYFKKNYSALKDGFEFGNCFKYVYSTQGMKDAVDAISSQLNYMGRIEKQIVYIGSTIDYFAMPNLTKEQADILAEKAADFKKLDPDNTNFIPYLFQELEKGKEDIFTFFENVKKSGAELGPGSIVKYKPITKDKYNGHEKEIEFYKMFDDDHNQNDKVIYKMKARTDDEIKRIRLITCNASYMYAEEWRKRFNQRTNLGTNDPTRIESRLKLGFFSRLLKGNSYQYDRLMKAYKEFNDPNHKNYLNEDLLKEAAEHYRDRKSSQGYTGEGNSIDNRRMKFALDIIATCDQCKEDQAKIFSEIDSDLTYGYPPKRESFLSSEDVEDKEYEYNVDTKELDKEIDFSKDMDNIDNIALQ